MTYQQTIDYLYNATPLYQNKGVGAYKPGLQNTMALDAHLGHPHRAYKTIHVAGTNGKGSVCHTLASVLQAAGYKVGLYTSPHLIDFRERIRVNGKKVSKKYVCDFIAKERSFFEPLRPSFFELTTLLALNYFKDQQVDIAVIEVGLGGRLDCTNIISPILSVVTNISIEHTQLLGNTEAEIAHEKGGIIKPSVPVVIGEANETVRKVFQSIADERVAPLYFADDAPEVIRFTTQARAMKYETASFGTLKHDLLGDYQLHNVNTILTALKHLDGVRISYEAIQKGFRAVQKQTHIEGRWQVISRHPLFVCDSGHNTGSWKYIADQLRRYSRPLLILGFSNDKDISRIMPLMPTHATYFWTQASVERAMPIDILTKMAQANGLDGQAFSCVGDAAEKALEQADMHDIIFVGGSFFVVSDILSFMRNNRNYNLKKS